MAYRKIGDGIQQEISTQQPNAGEILKWDGDKYTPSPDATSGVTDTFLLNTTNITNKFVDLTAVPLSPSNVRVVVIGGIEQKYSVDYTIVLDGGSLLKRLSWSGLGLENLLIDGDELIVEYD